MLLQIKRLVHVIIYLLNTSGLKDSSPEDYWYLKDKASEMNRYLQNKLGNIG